jgi:NADPH-dependent curcumin reductase
MDRQNRQIVLAERPTALVNEQTTRVEMTPAPAIGADEALIAVRYLSIDPTIRTWMDDAPGYLPPIGIGDVIRSGGIGEVIESNSDRYNVGDLVFGTPGWQDYAVADHHSRSMQVLPPGVDPVIALNVLGVTGLTAYFGLLEVGDLREGDVVVVSGAAGATGSTVGQIAKRKGAGTVIGIAGSDDKCRFITEELGFDAAINYKTEDIPARLRALAPRGIDLYFDNVGGEILDHCLARLAMRGRVVLCGAISGYNDPGRPVGPSNYVNLIIRRGRMEGFIILDYQDRFAEAQGELITWLLEGSLVHAEHLVDGLERAPEALNLLFTGGNTGKVIVKV